MVTPRSRLFSPHVSAAGKVQVYIHYRRDKLPSDATLADIGADDVLTSRPLGILQAWIPIAKLHVAASLGGVESVSLPIYGYAKNAAEILPAADTCSGVPSGLAIDNEAIAAENVGPVHNRGAKGRGVKVGVISTGVDCIGDSQAQGYLPSNVWIDPTLSGSGDEGTAMLEEVHAIAPDASLGFCGYEPSGTITTADFLQCMDDLAGWGADVISDDLGFIPVSYNYSNFTDPATGDNAITEFAQAHPNISLTTAGGNDGYDFYQANYEADSSPSSPGGPPISLNPTYTPGGPLSQYEAANRSYGSAMDFGAALGDANDSAIKVTLAPGATMFGDFTWNDPVNGPYDDLDLFLLQQNGSLACQPSGSSQWCSSTLNQMQYAGDPSVALPPLEFIEYTNSGSKNQTLYLVALCFNCAAHGTNPLHVKLYGLANGGARFNYVTFGGVNGHATLADEFTIAAAFYTGTGVRSTIESYSDTGPFTYGDWTGAPQTRAKPDITGTDCTTVSGAGGFGSPFCGTSAASPNVGAVIALLRGLDSTAEPDAAGWKQLAMNSANPQALTNYSVSAGGAGLVDAAAAATSVAPGDNPPTASDGTLTTKENQAASGTLQASDPDGDPLTFSIVTPPNNGRLSLNASTGAYTYTPNHDFSGADQFTFQASDGTLDSNPAIVTITVKETLNGGGGGAFGGLGLGVLDGLSGLLLFLRRKR